MLSHTAFSVAIPIKPANEGIRTVYGLTRSPPAACSFVGAIGDDREVFDGKPEALTW